MSKSEAPKRRHFSPTDKVAILKRHLLEGMPVSDLCDEFGIAPNLFYRWQKEFFENGHPAFENDRKCGPTRMPRSAASSSSKASWPQERSALRTHGGARPVKKRTWGTLKGRWVPHDTRDQVVDFVRTGPTRPSCRAAWSPGWASAPASSTTGNNASAK